VGDFDQRNLISSAGIAADSLTGLTFASPDKDPGADQVLLIVRHYDWERKAEERAAQEAMFRDIFGDPYPPLTLSSAWRSPEVTSLATSIDKDRTSDRTPELADALEATGCDDPVILGHCRGAGPHVRGCWALDLVLG
jgi:hypothetical protein